MYDKIRRSEQKYKVALDVLAYHSTCTEDEFNMLKSASLPDEIPDIDHFEFSPWKLTEFQKPLCVIYMFRDLFGLTRFDLDTLIKFSLTVRKNYRKVPYHNYTHGNEKRFIDKNAMLLLGKEYSTFNLFPPRIFCCQFNVCHIESQCSCFQASRGKI